MHPQASGGQERPTAGSGEAGGQQLGAGVRLSADPDPDADLDVTPVREPGLGDPAEDPDPPAPE